MGENGGYGGEKRDRGSGWHRKPDSRDVRITDDSGPIRVESLAEGLGLTCHALGVLFIGVKSAEGVRGAQQEETWPFGEGRG